MGWRGYSLSSRDQIIGVRFHTYIYEYDKYFSKRKRLEDIQILRMNIISKKFALTRNLFGRVVGWFKFSHLLRFKLFSPTSRGSKKFETALLGWGAF